MRNSLNHQLHLQLNGNEQFESLERVCASLPRSILFKFRKTVV